MTLALLALGVLCIALVLWAMRCPAKQDFSADHPRRERVGIPEPEMFSDWQWEEPPSRDRRGRAA